MENINLIIGNNIRELRKANKLTQSELAEKLNYSNKAVSRWESGEVVPDVLTLNKICELFNVSISSIFEENAINKRIKKSSLKFQMGNKLTISLLGVLLVWFIAVFIYVSLILISNTYFWQIFVYAVPSTCIVGIVFNSIWGKQSLNFILISILIWTLLVCIYLSLLSYNLWPIFLLGIPMQVGITLWCNIYKNNAKKKLDN